MATAQDIKKLRETTGAGMMDCKKAFVEANDDFDAAVEWLRKKGLAAAQKKSGRVAAEGLVCVAVEGNKGAIIELNSETDFVAKNETFQKLAQEISAVAVENGNNIDQLKAAKHPNGKTIDETVQEAVGTIGENLQLRRSATLQAGKGIVAAYIHNTIQPNMGKIGVLVAVESDAPADKLEEIGKQIAMHVAAAKPESLTTAELDPALVEKERDIFRDQALASGKPAEIVDKMIDGRIRKYYEQVVLLEQAFVIDGKTKVSDVLAEASKEAGAPISISGYVCFTLGEGIEKEESNFAEEVAAAVNG